MNKVISAIDEEISGVEILNTICLENIEQLKGLFATLQQRRGK